MRYHAFPSRELLGQDPFAHASIISEYRKTGYAKTINENNTCGKRNILNPYGFYTIPTILKTLSVEDAMGLTNILAGVTSIILIYLLLKKYSEEYAIITIIILTFSYAHIVRTNYFYYRGEVLVMPLILLSILMLKEKKILSGILTGITTWVWNGFPLAIIIYIITHSTIILKKYLGEEKIKKDSIILVLNNIIIYTIIKTGEILDIIHLNHVFTQNYLLLIIMPLTALLIIMNVVKDNEEFRTKLPLSLIIIGTILAIIIVPDKINTLINPYELISGGAGFYGTIQELQPPTLSEVFSAHSILIILAPIGLITLYKKEKKMLTYLSGILTALTILMFRSTRFLHLSSYAITLLIAHPITLIYNKMKPSKTAYALILIILALLLLSSFGEIKNTTTLLHEEWKNTLNNIPENSCVITWWDRGSMAKYYGLSTYTDSVSGQNIGRIKKTAQYLLTNKTTSFETENNTIIVISYELIQPSQTKKPESLALKQMIRIASPEEELIISYPEFLRTNNNNEYVFRINKTIIKIGMQENSPAIIENKEVKKTYYVKYNKVKKITSNNTYHDACIIYSRQYGIIYYLNKELCNTRLIKFLMEEETNNTKLLHSEPHIKTYQII